MNLPQHEPDDADQADEHRHPHHRVRERIRFDVGETEHEAAETEHGQAHGEEVGLRVGVVRAEVAQSECRQHESDHADDGQGQEDGAPSVQIGLQATQRRTDGGRDAHGHAHGAHGHASTGERVDGEHGDLQDGPHHAGAHGLERTAEQHEDERRAEPCEHGSDGEHEHRGDDDLPGGEPSGEIGGQRHHDAHDELEDRGEPLAGGHGDAEFGDDGRQCGA